MAEAILSEGIAQPSASQRGGSAWIITFADLMAIILSFFIMIFSMSSIQTKAWLAVVTGLSDELSPGRDLSVVGEVEQARPLRVLEPKGIDLGYLESVMRDKFQAHPVLQHASMLQKQDRLAIALPLDLLFETGVAIPAASADRTLMTIGEALRSVKNRIEIHVYANVSPTGAQAGVIADDDPLGAGWELAIARAMVAAKLVADAGLARAPIPVGHGVAPSGKTPQKIELIVREMGAE